MINNTNNNKNSKGGEPDWDIDDNNEGEYAQSGNKEKEDYSILTL